MFKLPAKYPVMIILMVITAFAGFSTVQAEEINSDCKSSSTIDTQQAGAKREVIENKLKLLESILSKSPTAKRIEASGDNEAIELLHTSRNFYNEALVLIDKECLNESEQLLNNGLRILENASQKITNKERKSEIAKQEYELKLSRIKSYRKAYQQILSDKNPDNGQYLDEQKLDEIVKSASTLNEQGDFEQAHQEIEKAVSMLEATLTALRDKQTLVYQLKFDSIEDHYAYELETNYSYTKLLTMILNSNTSGSSLAKIEELVKRNQALKKTSDEMLEKGDMESALGYLEQGNENLIHALRYTGIGL